MTATKTLKGKSNGFRILAFITIVFHVFACVLRYYCRRPVSYEFQEIAAEIDSLGFKFFMLPSLFFGLILLYKMWRQIPRWETPTTPGKAVGFLLIPFFNFYWFFIALGGLAESQYKCLLKYDPGRGDHSGIVYGICVLYILFILTYIWTSLELPLPWIIDVIITLVFATGRLTLIGQLSRAASALAEYEADASNETPTINVD